MGHWKEKNVKLKFLENLPFYFPLFDLYKGTKVSLDHIHSVNGVYFGGSTKYIKF